MGTGLVMGASLPYFRGPYGFQASGGHIGPYGGYVGYLLIIMYIAQDYDFSFKKMRYAVALAAPESANVHMGEIILQ